VGVRLLRRRIERVEEQTVIHHDKRFEGFTEKYIQRIVVELSLFPQKERRRNKRHIAPTTTTFTLV
jgi:hypothetical protein